MMGHTGVSKVPPELRGGNILENLKLQGVTFSANIQSFPDRGREPNSAFSWFHTAPISLLLYTRRAESIQHFGMRRPSSSSAGGGCAEELHMSAVQLGQKDRDLTKLFPTYLTRFRHSLPRCVLQGKPGLCPRRCLSTELRGAETEH